jgi:hypothetical protein
MRQLLPIFLSTVAICAFAAATPAVAQQMDPEGPAHITAEPPHTPRHGPGNGYDNGPFAALGAILAGPFDASRSSAITRDPPNTAQPDAGGHMDPEGGNSQGEYRGVP